MPQFPSVTPTPTQLSSRHQMKDYCLRRLGAPVIEINVDDDQVEDRVQDAIEWFQEYHFDGTERMYLKALIEASKLTLLTPDANLLSQGEIVTGQTSGAYAKFYSKDFTMDYITNTQVFSESVIQLKQTQGTFVDGEIISGSVSGATLQLAATNAFSLGNWDNQYLEIPDAVLGVNRIFILGPGTAGMNTRNIFDVVYQFRLNDMYDLMSTDLIYYAQVKQHLSLLDMMLPGERSIRFNRKQNRLYIDVNWPEILTPNTYIMVECYRLTDPAEFSKVYNDLFLKRYATALIKRQWGNNMKKFDKIQLPGGVTLNGKEIYDEAMEEIKEIEKDMQDRYELHPFFEIG